MPYITPVSRECPACRFTRIPYAKVVKQGKKHWVIYQCPMCKMKDIDTYIPRRLFNGKSQQFEDELIDEDTQDRIE